MKAKVTYGLLGLALILGLWTTRVKGIDSWTQTCLDRALETDTSSIYEGFDIRQFPLDVHYGKVEYSYINGKITEKAPDTVPAFSAFPTKVGPVVKTFPIRDFRKAFDTGDLSAQDLENMYVSMLVHEAFHAFQMDHGMTMAINDLGQIDMNDPEVKKREVFNNLLAKFDDDKTYQDKWLAMMDGLSAWSQGQGRAAYDAALEDLDAHVRSALEPDQYEIFIYFVHERELVEGTARYVENLVLEQLGSEKNGEYNGVYDKGQGQFYGSGDLKARILAREGKFKNLRFDMSVNLDDLLEIGG